MTFQVLKCDNRILVSVRVVRVIKESLPDAVRVATGQGKEILKKSSGDPDVFCISMEMKFPSKHWTRLARVSLHGATAAEQAVDGCFPNCRKPVPAPLPRRGLLQVARAFFLQPLLISLLKRADRRQDRCPSYLSDTLSRFLPDDAERNRALRRGGIPPRSLGAGAFSKACPPAPLLPLPSGRYRRLSPGGGRRIAALSRRPPGSPGNCFATKPRILLIAH